MSSVARPSQTRDERREKTRRIVLEATVRCLIELGYARTTTLEVQKRARVSRGALLHHFPSKFELLSETVKYLATLRGREIEDRATDLPDGGARIDAVIDLLWQSCSGPLFYVAMELRNAARTDAELRAVLVEVEREVHQRILDQSRRLFGEPTASSPGFAGAMDMMLQFMIGAAMTAILHCDDERENTLVARWKTLFPRMLDTPRAVPAGAAKRSSGARPAIRSAGDRVGLAAKKTNVRGKK